MSATATAFLPASLTPPHRVTNPRRNTRTFMITAQQGGSEGNSVDDNMIVLRMRIKKAKVSEIVSKISSDDEAKAMVLDEAPASADWKEWERRVFTHYHEGVVDSVEMLQAYLMNTRPAVALGVLALVAMSVPFSTSVVMSNALKVARGLLAGCHVCIDIDF